MLAWRREAIARFPEHKKEIASEENPYDLWIKIYEWFVATYETAGRDDRIAPFYDYLRWTWDQPRHSDVEHDLATAAACCFVEHIPDYEHTKRDMVRWLSRAEVEANKSIFIYHHGEQGYAKILSLYEAGSKRKK